MIDPYESWQPITLVVGFLIAAMLVMIPLLCVLLI